MKKNVFGALMSIILGLILILAFGIGLQKRIGGLKDFCGSKEVLTVTADYVSSERFTESDEDGSVTKYRITRQCIIHGEPVTYTAVESYEATASVSVVAFLSGDGTYHFRKDSRISGEVLKAVLDGIVILMGGGFIFFGLRELFRPNKPAKEQE